MHLIDNTIGRSAKEYYKVKEIVLNPLLNSLKSPEEYV